MTTLTERPTLAALPAMPQPPAGGSLRADLLAVIQARIDDHPRSQQKRIGPSEIGTPCARKLAYKLSGTPESRSSDKWKATVGTAIHAWLADTFVTANAAQRPVRWLVETKVDTGSIGPNDIDGSCDLYDRLWQAAIDWKTCGPSRLTHYRRHGPGEQYRTQVHDYGRGWTARGLPVRDVVIVFLPRNGDLTDAHVWSEAYDPAIAIQAYERANRVSTLVAALGTGPALNLTAADGSPAIGTADAPCAFCDWYLPGSRDLSRGCPGDPSIANRNPGVSGAGIVRPA